MFFLAYLVVDHGIYFALACRVLVHSMVIGKKIEQGAGFLLPGAGFLLPLPDMLGHRPQHRLVRIRGGRHPRYGLLHRTRGGGPQRGHLRRMLGVHPPHRLVGRKLVRAHCACACARTSFVNAMQHVV